MSADLLPLRVLLLRLFGCVNRQQHAVIESLVEEHRVLRDPIGDRRLRQTDRQWPRSAAKGKRLEQAVLAQVASIVTSDTTLRWHRPPRVAFDGPECRVGARRPPGPGWRTTRPPFLRTHWYPIVGTDFFTVEVTRPAFAPIL